MNETNGSIDSMSEQNNTGESVPRLALRPREAARALGIGTRLLWELTNKGVIPHLRLNSRIVYPVDSLQKFLAEQSKGTK